MMFLGPSRCAGPVVTTSRALSHDASLTSRKATVAGHLTDAETDGAHVRAPGWREGTGLWDELFTTVLPTVARAHMPLGLLGLKGPAFSPLEGLVGP